MPASCSTRIVVGSRAAAVEQPSVRQHHGILLAGSARPVHLSHGAGSVGSSWLGYLGMGCPCAGPRLEQAVAVRGPAPRGRGRALLAAGSSRARAASSSRVAARGSRRAPGPERLGRAAAYKALGLPRRPRAFGSARAAPELLPPIPRAGMGEASTSWSPAVREAVLPNQRLQLTAAGGAQAAALAGRRRVGW
jgi:hypothetical protein